jgi:hypothetical protein
LGNWEEILKREKKTCVDERESQLLLHTRFAVFADPFKLLSQKKGPGPIGPQGCDVKVTATNVLRILIFFKKKYCFVLKITASLVLVGFRVQGVGLKVQSSVVCTHFEQEIKKRCVRRCSYVLRYAHASVKRDLKIDLFYKKQTRSAVGNPQMPRPSYIIRSLSTSFKRDLIIDLSEILLSTK